VDSNSMISAIQAIAERFELVHADTPALLDDVFRLRYQVYCLERGFEPAQGGRETDLADAFSAHALVREQSTGRAIGTVRLIAPAIAGSGSSARMPIWGITGPAAWHHLPRAETAEISRFALSKRVRVESGVSDSMLRLLLMRGVVALSGQLGLTHWCALLEPSLLRLLRPSGISFQPVGVAVEHHGLRQPVVGVIRDVLDQMARERPLLWDFVTLGGTLWRQPELCIAA
jgi:N-acyl-L-homoserine lactone synthetase